MAKKQQPARRGKTRGKAAAKVRTKTARAGTPKPSLRAKSSAAQNRASSGAKAAAKQGMRRLAAKVASQEKPRAGTVYALVCDVEGRMQDGLTLGDCNDHANTHLEEHPEHDCDCFREGTSDVAIAKRFRARAAKRASAGSTR
jgi:hypothetical protein